MAQIFAHKGIIGICALTVDETEEKGYKLSEAIVNNIEEPGQLGCVCEADKCEFSQEAIDLLKTVKKSGDCIGEVDIYGDPNKVIFNWLGGPTRMLDVETAEGSRDYNPSLYDHVTVVPNNPPQEFVDAVDSMLLERENG